MGDEKISFIASFSLSTANAVTLTLDRWENRNPTRHTNSRNCFCKHLFSFHLFFLLDFGLIGMATIVFKCKYTYLLYVLYTSIKQCVTGYSKIVPLLQCPLICSNRHYKSSSMIFQRSCKYVALTVSTISPWEQHITVIRPLGAIHLYLYQSNFARFLKSNKKYC